MINMDPDFIRGACAAARGFKNDQLLAKTVEMMNKKLFEGNEKRFTRFMEGKRDEQYFKRYGDNCFCEEGERRVYGSTLKPGVAYAMLMPINSCTHCTGMMAVFSNALVGFYPKKFRDVNPALFDQKIEAPSPTHAAPSRGVRGIIAKRDVYVCKSDS